MLTQRIAVLVSGGGTNLQALIDAQNSGIIKSGEISLVIADRPDVFAINRASKADIKTLVINKKSYNTKKDFENEVLKALSENSIDIIVLAGFLCILSKDFITHYKNKIINVHPSLIPSFCGDGYYGLKVHEAALNYGVKLTGATVHFVNEVVDGGKIIRQKAVCVLPNDTPETLQKRVMEEAEWQILPLAVEDVCANLANNLDKGCFDENV